MKIDSPVPARRSSTWPLATFLAFGLAAAALATAQEGVKQTEAVIKKSEDAVKAIADGRQQLEKTLATYNAIIEGSATDTKAAYKDLNNEIKDCESKVTDITKRRDAMNAEADKLYKSWDESIATIATPDLKKRSETRLAQTRERLGKVGEAGQVARTEYEAFMKNLKDQITYLGHDLNPTAVASLKGDATKLNKRAEKLFEKIDATTGAANSSIDALRRE